MSQVVAGTISQSDSETMAGQTESDCDYNEEELLLSEKKSNKLAKHTTMIRILSLIILAFSELLGGCTLSILAPFYSREAEVHGLSVAESGAVFASVFVFQIIFVPIFGKLITKIGSTRLFIGGVFLAGITNVAFGFLPFIKSGEGFLAVSLIMRSVTAIGEAAMNAAVLPLARRRGGEGREASVMSWIESMNAAGTTFGPFIGGILFNYGGFFLPFLVSGGLMILCGLAAVVVLDPSEEREEVEDDRDEEAVVVGENMEENPVVEQTFWTLLSSSSVALAVIITVSTGVAEEWFQPSLEPYVREQFAMNPYQASLLFVIDGAVYALASPVVGMFLDRCLDPLMCTLGGTLTICLGYLLMGTLPPFVMETSLSQICVGVVLVGLGMAASFMGTITLMNREEEKKGKSTEKMAGLMNSLWLTCFSLGGFLGAWGGGAAFDKMGWSTSCLVVALVQLLGVFIIICVTFSQNCGAIKRARNKMSRDQVRKGLLDGERKTGYGAVLKNDICVDV